MTYGALRQARRVGGLYSELLSQRVGSLIGAAIGARVHPTALTVGNLVLGVTSGLVAILGVHVRPTWLVGSVVLLGWQLAYALDCADGQLARVKGITSSSGRRVDLLCDFAVQAMVVTAVATAVRAEYELNTAVLALFAASWMVNLYIAVLFQSDDLHDHRLLPSTGSLVQVVKLSRDYGFIVLLLGVGYAFSRTLLAGLLLGFLALNTVFLLASIARASKLSFRASAETTLETLRVGEETGSPAPGGSPRSFVDVRQLPP